MNTKATQGTKLWTFVLIAFFLTFVTMVLAYAAFILEERKRSRSDQSDNASESTIQESAKYQRRTFPFAIRKIRKKGPPVEC